MDKQGTTGSNGLLQAITRAIDEKKFLIQEALIFWATNNPPHYPWRQAGKTPYEVLMGELWLSQTAPVVAEDVYQPFLQKFIDIRSLAEAREDDLDSVLASFHLQDRTVPLRALARGLLKEGNGTLPHDSESFAKACGVDCQTGNTIMCFGYGLPIAIVDSNVTRLLARVFARILPPHTGKGLIKAIGESLLPERYAQQYNRGLLDVAELFCRREVPLCSRCPLGEMCDFAQMPYHADTRIAV